MSPAPVFDFHARTRLIAGPGCVERLGELCRELGGRRALLVTDPGLVAAGHARRATESLEGAGLEVARFAAVRENPTTADVDACLAAAREAAPDLLVAVGGGSSIDTAKGANFLFTNGGTMEDYWGVGAAPRPFLPLVAVPTTAGTGSEVQSFALISRESDHQKMACGDPQAAPRLALLDPTLTATLPRAVAASTGLDTLTHAVESFVTTRRNAVSALFAREAFRLAERALPRVLADSPPEDARGEMLVAAAWAGLAIEHSMLGAAHSMANPLTARFGVPHGQAVGVMLPHVVRYNGVEPEIAAAYAQLGREAGLSANGGGGDVVEALAGRIEALLALAEVPAALGRWGVAESDVPALAAEAARQWTARFNPRAVGAADFEVLLRGALGER